MAHVLPTDLMVNGTGLFLGLAKWANTVTSGLFWTIILLIFCIVLYIAASRYTTERAFGFASFAGMFGAILLTTVQLMSWWIASAFILSGVGGLIWMVVKRD